MHNRSQAAGRLAWTRISTASESGLKFFPLVLVVTLGVGACGTSNRDREADADPADPDPAGAARARVGVIFDPSRVRAGDSIAGLVVDRVSVSRAVVDSSFVGDIAFRGEIELSGRTFPHFDADASDAACFEADSASAAELPRWAGDRRRAWFCFSNAAEATRALGPSRAERPARIVITDFVIHRGLSDQVNSARFVRVVAPRSAAGSSDRALESAAKEIVAFLQGKRRFETIHLADTVVLYLSPEGGGTRAAFTRDDLRTPSNWMLQSGRQSYSFVPPRSLTRVTAKAGRHLKCLEYPLESLFSHLARLPHAGVKLEPETTGSCLQTWNATFVFDTAAQPPRLVAAVYDQWEW
jgi:hypothetical protein